MVVRVGMSWNLGVKPARTTLSDEAIHSMMSVHILRSVRHPSIEMVWQHD